MGVEGVANLVALAKELDGGALAHLHAGSTSESVGWQVRRELPCRQAIPPLLGGSWRWASSRVPMTYAADLRAHLEVVVADLEESFSSLSSVARWPGGGRGEGEVEARWGGGGRRGWRVAGVGVVRWVDGLVGWSDRAVARCGAGRCGAGGGALCWARWAAVGVSRRGVAWRGRTTWPLVAFFCFFCPFSLLSATCRAAIVQT